MGLPAYANEPQIQYLSQVIDQIDRGEIQIPDFQRPPRWTDDQRRRLLDSVTKGYPIGSLMILRTGLPIGPRREIGRHTLSPPGETSARQYLLDGFQRMSTLFAALRPSEPAPAGPDKDGNRWALGYNLARQTWVFLNTVSDDERGVVVPGHLIFQGKLLLKFQRGLGGPDADTLVDRCDELVNTLREYKLALIPLVTESLGEATRIFGLLNTEGTRMSDLDLVTAVTWQEGGDLRTRLEDARERLREVDWGELDERFLLAALRTAVDLDIYESTALDLADKLKDHEDALDKVVESLQRTARLLNDRCQVCSLGLLPYSYQAVLIADILRRVPRPSAELENHLVSWFWWTTAWSTFSGISGYRMTAMLDYLRALQGGPNRPWPGRAPPREPGPPPNAWDPRGARCRMLTVVLFRAVGGVYNLPDVVQRLRLQAADAVFRGLPRLKGSVARDLGNMFLAPVSEEPGLIRALKERCGGAAHHEHPLFTDEAQRRAHLISNGAWIALGSGDADTFIDLRRSTLLEQERVLLDEAGRPPMT